MRGAYGHHENLTERGSDGQTDVQTERQLLLAMFNGKKKSAHHTDIPMCRCVLACQPFYLYVITVFVRMRTFDIKTAPIWRYPDTRANNMPRLYKRVYGIRRRPYRCFSGIN